MKKIIVLIGFLYIVYPSFVPALEVTTHEVINESITSGVFNDFSLDKYLKNHLGFKKGRDEIFYGREASKFFNSGGVYEDKPAWYLPYLRSKNHFHDPVNDKGFSGYFEGIFLTGDSVVDWAQKPIASQSPGGYYSWKDVRNYYHQALTATDKDSRDFYFAETFRGLGQLMHLMQDSSVPAHTRDDVHLWFHYEKWVNKNIRGLQITPIIFDRSIFHQSGSGHPIANIFDTNQYTGDNPEVTIRSNIGLTEYTNANFFSEDTIEEPKFKFPDLKKTEIVKRPYSNYFGTIYEREYYLKRCCGESNAGNGYLLATVDLFDYWRKKLDLSDTLRKLPGLDDNVYSDYGFLLLPRALGYSAGLLEYFFRGQLEVTAIPIFVQNTLSAVRLRIQNITPETLESGEFVLYYRYTPKGGASDGSEDIFGQAWPSAKDPGVSVYQMKTGEDMVVDFSLWPYNPPIESFESLKFTLVFNGTLGKEVGAVVGYVFSAGKVIFNEEWDNGLTGNHDWGHEGYNVPDPAPSSGQKINFLEGDILVKENRIFNEARLLGEKNNSFVGVEIDGRFKDILPILVTPKTYVQFKIDEMFFDQNPVPSRGLDVQLQELFLRFTGWNIALLTQPGMTFPWSPKQMVYHFPLRSICVMNLHRMFADHNLPIPEPLYLEEITFEQYLWQVGGPASAAYYQRMRADFVRIVEATEPLGEHSCWTVTSTP